MQTKELIHNRILNNAKLIWGTQNVGRMDPLVRLMLEELTNELFLIQNNLSDIDTLLLEKLAKQLTPDTHVAIRPAHAIMQITPTRPTFDLDRREPFYLKEIAQSFQKQGIGAITFCPVIDVRLTDIKITHSFHDTTLWSVNNVGNKTPITYTSEQAEYNTVWFALEINPKVEDLNKLYFYFDFPTVDENHEYYDLLTYAEWTIGGQNIKIKQGLPNHSTEKLNDFDENILRFYHNRYLHIKQSIPVHSIPKERLPHELAILTNTETEASLYPKTWVKITFPKNFKPEDLDKMSIALNAIPISNKRRYLRKLNKNDLTTGVGALPAGNKELFLDIDMVKDSGNQIYHCVNAENIKHTGTYHVKPSVSGTQEELATFDYLERLLDTIQEERLEFPSIDAEKVSSIIESLTNMYANVEKKSVGNEKFADQSIGKILVHPNENVHTINVYYWATNGMLANSIPRESVLMAHKDSPLKKENTILLTPVCGGKEFSSATDLMAINKYVLTSGNKVLTEENIIDFCKSELGKMVSSIEVEKNIQMSPKPKEGLICMICIKITSSANYAHNQLTQTGFLRDLKTRLQKRSPDNFKYQITISN